MPVTYGPGEVGYAFKLSRQAANGIVKELAAAGVAPKWEKQMLDRIRNKNSINPDVLDFFTMGDVSFDPENDKIQSLDKNPAGTKARMEAFKAKFKAEEMPKEPKVVLSPFFLDPATAPPFKKNSNLDPGVDLSSMMNEVTFSWPWSLKFMFQRFTVRELGEGDEQFWNLWPFTQPDLNNRQIDVANFLWDPKAKDKRMIPTLLKDFGIDFDSQTAYSVPYQVLQSPSDGSAANLVAMVSGTQGDEQSNDMVFSDLAAKKCGLEEMDRCFKAMTVSSQGLPPRYVSPRPLNLPANQSIFCNRVWTESC